MLNKNIIYDIKFVRIQQYHYWNRCFILFILNNTWPITTPWRTPSHNNEITKVSSANFAFIALFNFSNSISRLIVVSSIHNERKWKYFSIHRSVWSNWLRHHNTPFSIFLISWLTQINKTAIERRTECSMDRKRRI